METASAKTRVSHMLEQLEDNNQELEMQRLEIKRLRDQVHGLVHHIERQTLNSSPTQLSPSASDGESGDNLPKLETRNGSNSRGYSRASGGMPGQPPALVIKSQSTPALR